VSRVWSWHAPQWLLVMIGLLVLPASSAAQQGMRTYSARVENLSGTPLSFRVHSQRMLLDEGLGVTEVAACDCLVVSGVAPLREGGPAGQVVQVRIHLMKSQRNVLLDAVVEVVVGTHDRWSSLAISDHPSEPADAAPPAVGKLLRRITDSLARARIPTR